MIMLPFMLMVGILLLPGKPFFKEAEKCFDSYHLITSESSLQTVAQEVCTRPSPNIGSNIQTQFFDNSPNIDKRYYLNIAEPAHCSGIISSVDYCYYGPSQYSNNLAWGAGVALYRSQADGSYRRVSGTITLSKRAPSNQLSPNPNTDLLLNFNCDTYYVLNSIVHVQEGDVFGALVFQDQRFLFTGVGGLDLVGDSSCGYQMMTRSINTFRINWSSDRGILQMQMLETLTGLSPDTGRRVLHIFADISKSSINSTKCIQFILSLLLDLIHSSIPPSYHSQ